MHTQTACDMQKMIYYNIDLSHLRISFGFLLQQFHVCCLTVKSSNKFFRMIENLTIYIGFRNILNKTHRFEKSYFPCKSCSLLNLLFVLILSSVFLTDPKHMHICWCAILALTSRKIMKIKLRKIKNKKH